MRVWRGPRIIPDRSGDNRLVAITFFPLDSFSSGQSNEKGRQ
jgi:hypothetical protein